MSTVATRYARALHQAAQEKGDLAGVSASVQALAAALEDAGLTASLSQPLARSQRAQLAEGMAAAVKAPASLKGLLGLLAENRRLPLLPQVLVAFAKLQDEAAGILPVKVESATPLTDAQKTSLISVVKTHTGTTQVRLEETVDASLLGGFRAFFSGMVWDASVRGGFSRLTAQLQSKNSNIF